MKINNFIKRSLAGTLTFLKYSIFAQEYAQASGFLQSLDPRIKIISFLALILSALFASSFKALIFIYAFCLFLVIISKINLVFYLKRTWIFIPLFSLFIALPALLNPQQRDGGWFFVLRVTICVSLAVLLNITTRHFELLKVLRIFKIQQIFIMTLGMCYRYIYLFVEIIQNTYLAISSRIGIGLPYQKGQQVVAWNIASLWNRSVWLNEQVYQAMVSRGYQGEALAWNDFKMRTRDWLWLALVAVIIWII